MAIPKCSIDSTHIIQINVNPTVVAKNKVFDNIYFLDWVWISIVDGDEPGKFDLNELARGFACP